jgi:hypothetical protein
VKTTGATEAVRDFTRRRYSKPTALPASTARAHQHFVDRRLAPGRPSPVFWVTDGPASHQMATIRERLLAVNATNGFLAKPFPPSGDLIHSTTNRPCRHRPAPLRNLNSTRSIQRSGNALRSYPGRSGISSERLHHPGEYAPVTSDADVRTTGSAAALKNSVSNASKPRTDTRLDATRCRTSVVKVERVSSRDRHADPDSTEELTSRYCSGFGRSRFEKCRC